MRGPLVPLCVTIAIVAGCAEPWPRPPAIAHDQYVREFQEWRPFAFGVALVAVMILRPQGLVPSRRRAREFEDRKVEAEEAAADA